MSHSSFHHLSDEALLFSARQAVQKEREATHEVLFHLLEVDRRHLHLECGFASLFEFCTEALGYCAGSAQIRIQGMRLLRDLPSESERTQVMAKLGTGDLKLTQLATVQRLSRTVKVEQGRKVEVAEKLALLEKIEGKNTRETEKIIAQALELPKHPEGTELKLHVDEETLQLLEEFKILSGHSNPEGNASLLFKQALALGVEALRKRKTGAPLARGSSCEVKQQQQTIPRPTQRIVWRKNDVRCSYVFGLDPEEAIIAWKIFDCTVMRTIGGGICPTRLESLRYFGRREEINEGVSIETQIVIVYAGK